ncbi:cytochrome P460 family protein [Spongiibacter sp. KMU-166]|uniref:Cytochrome P460 family protein n=1 Tax=Spongiibacter thalassae TaxID=2721624 RepID=A0ABX1GHE1_9GAMM|nr:cytochrome P460 family protein [Spongiibacter thalassae]NKI17802.1 cytochrome P460 family protein [Spongiibacter thalassae]
MKRRAGFIALTLSLLVQFGTAQAEEDAGELPPYSHKMFDIPASATVLSDNYRSSWARLSGFEYSGLHWNQFIILYSNIGQEVYKENYLQYITWFEDPDDDDNTPEYSSYPEGTVILKENFASKQGKPNAAISVTAMIKKPAGYDSANGDWEYLQFGPDGTVLLQGAASKPYVEQQCGACHRSVADRDYVFAHVFSALK